MDLLIAIDSFVVVLYIVFGTFGNLLIIAAAILRPKLRSPPNMFIVNVAVTDVIMSSYGMSNVMVHVLGNAQDGEESEKENDGIGNGDDGSGKEGYGDTGPMCIVTGMAIVVSCGVSLLSLCFIAFNRYMSVCQFAYYTKVFTKRNLVIMITGIWLFSLGIVLASYFLGLCRFHYDQDQVSCTYNNKDSPCTFLFIVVGIVIPSLLAIVFYVLIYKKLHETSTRLEKHNSGLGQKKMRKSRRETKSIVMMFTAFALFIIVWFPYGIVMVLDSYADQNPLLIKIVTWLAFSNCGINWIVYGAMNRNFRNGYRDVIMGCRRQRPRSGSAETDDSTPKAAVDNGGEAGTDRQLRESTRSRCGENKRNNQQQH